MEFTIVSHACLSVTDGAKTLVLDPWLSEPAYWSSWWHAPKLQVDDAIFDADYIYITHWHFDHFDTKTLKRFRRNPMVLLPKFPVSSLAPLVRRAGLDRIVELDHGATFELAPGFSLTSYQAALQDDSVAAIRSGATTLVNLNDAKPLPSGWRRIRRDFPSVDFMLRSHSPAWSYPTRYTFEAESDRIVLDAKSYMDAFVSATRTLRPRYAIPFASGICHLHREVIEENRALVPPARLKEYVSSCADVAATTELVIMPSGSRWSDGSFHLAADTVGMDPMAYALQRASAEAEHLERVYKAEAAKPVFFEEFDAYFTRCSKALGLLRLLLRGVVWVFPIQDDPQGYWAFDFGAGKVQRFATMPPQWSVEFTVTPAVLSAALRNEVFSNIDVSKRWRVRVRKGALVKHLLACTAISLFEAGFLSLRNLLSPRFVAGYFKRLPEIADYAAIALRLLLKGPSSVRDVAGIAEG